MQRAVGTVPRRHGAGLLQELDELRRAHLAARHGELAMANGPEPTDMALDRHVVGRIGEHHRGNLIPHQPLVAFQHQRAAALDPVTAEQPEISHCGRGRADDLRHGVGSVLPALLRFDLQTFDAQVDLTHVEAGQLEREIEIEQRDIAQLFGKQSVVPSRQLAQAIVGSPECGDLSVVEMRQADRGDLRQPELLGGQKPRVTSDHGALVVHQDRHDKAERSDAV